ncbi:MAG: sulfate transporter [Methylomonas sp.]|nr:MAG: sulfate transporter [Methylomonas sp.]
MSEIMKGYKQDSFGRLVPIEAIDKIDLLRDQTVSKIVQSGLDMQEKMTQWKRQAMDDIVAFCQLSAENYGVKWGGKKGNLSLVSYDGRYKVLIAVSDSLAFDERLQVAKSLIDECIHEWTKDSKTEIKTLVEHAFQTDRQGNINVGRIFSLMRVKIEHPKWQMAMEALKDSIQVTATSQYLRLYQRVGDTDKYEQIPLDLARL